MDDATPPVSPAAASLATAIGEAINRRIAACEAAGNEVQKKKWLVELKALTLPAYAEALASMGFESSKLDGLAVYATMKLRRLVSAFLGTGSADPYTVEILRNAKALAGEGGALSNKAMVASLSLKVKLEGITLPSRRRGSESTASTQASSTRQVLAALGAGRMVGEGKDRRFEIDFGHPVVARIVGGAAA